MTTIRTSSQNQFNKIRKYINNKRIANVANLSNGLYTITLLDLSSHEVDTLIQKMTRYFHLTPKQQEPIALAA